MTSHDLALVLTDEDVERIAARTIELLREVDPTPQGLVDVAAVALSLSVSEKFVRAHATELGGRQLVPGGPWRFDLAKAFRAGCDSAERQAREVAPPVRARSRSVPGRVSLLPVRGDR